MQLRRLAPTIPLLAFTALATPAQPLDLKALEGALSAAVNAQRADHGLPPLAVSARLERAARRHSRDMAEQSYFDHTAPDHRTPADRVHEAGISYRLVGENIASLEEARDPAGECVAAWMASPSHRENILNRLFTHTGVGVWVSSGGKVLVTQLFLARPPATATSLPRP